VGQAPQLIARALLACALSAAAGGLSAQQMVATGSCRDRLPQGAYELRMPDGLLRVSGAFDHGKRTGPFVFWTSTGARVAKLSFTNDVLNGAVTLWYSPGKPNVKEEPRPKLEAVYVNGRLSGTKRSWFANGQPRAAFRYANGTLVEAKAWDESGEALSASDARAAAARDLELDNTFYETLGGIVRANHPAC
jgi:hypothetical protein